MLIEISQTHTDKVNESRFLRILLPSYAIITLNIILIGGYRENKKRKKKKKYTNKNKPNIKQTAKRHKQPSVPIQSST